MNRERRARLTKLMEAIEEIQQEEAHAYDNMPHGPQDGPGGAAIEAAADHLAEAVESVRIAIEGEE